MTLGLLDDIADYAREEPAVARLLQQPYADALFTLRLPVGEERLLEQLCQRLGVATLGTAFSHPRIVEGLAATGRTKAEKLLMSVLGALADATYDETSDEDIAAPRVDAPPSAQLVAPGAVPPPPVDDLAKLRAWAERYGVTGLLAEPMKNLGTSGHYDHAYVREALATATVEDVLRPKAGVPVVRAKQAAAVRWEENIRRETDLRLENRARELLHAAASVRAGILGRRARASAAADKLSPPLAALEQRLVDARLRVAARVTERPLGTFVVDDLGVMFDPLRFTYREHPLGREVLGASNVVLTLESDPIEPDCTCGRGKMGCAHALAAIDEAIDLVRAPSAARERVAAVLAIPAWTRVLSSFDADVARLPSPAAAEIVQRLVWRLSRSGLDAQLEVLLQKRLKSGGFSAGARLRPDQLLANAKHFTDARDHAAAAAILAGHSYHPTISRDRLARALEALNGHPLLSISGTSTRARVVRRPLGLVLEEKDGAITIACFIGALRYDAADLAPYMREPAPLVSVDPERAEVTICRVDARASALVIALAKNPTRFPAEAHEPLVRALGSLQESVELALPASLTGEEVTADARPIVRLTPREGGEVEVAIVVRPVPGGPVALPGAGAPMVLASVDGRRVSARRDFARELAPATELASLLPPPGDAPGDEASPWSFVADEAAALDLLAKLREMGDAAVVEWADARRVTLGVAKARELRVRVTDRRDWFAVDGEVSVDGQAVSLAMLLDAVRNGRRYVRIGPGRFAAIEAELRERVERAGDVLHAGKKGLELAVSGVAALGDLVTDQAALQAAARFRDVVRRIGEAQTAEPELPAGLVADLRPYQLEGYRWLMRLAMWGSGGCLADDMGLGKTVQALAMLLARSARGAALVVAPTSVGPNWLQEAARFAPSLRVRLYRGPGRAALLAEAKPGDILVTSYTLVQRDAEALAKTRFATLVLDEAQAVKNAETRRARAVLGLDAELTVALTGTPVENHLGDLWSLMRFVAPGLLGSWEHFRDRFANAIEKSKDAGRRASLARLLKPFLLRRRKAEVAPELPPRIEIQRLVQLSAAERVLYDAVRIASLEAIASGEGDARFTLFAALTRLRRLACHPRLHDPDSPVPSSKLAAFLEIVEELRDEGHRALVFSQFTSHLELVRAALDARGVSYDYLDGSTPLEERTRRVAAFQAGGKDLFLISLKAGGSGLNLTAADYVIHLDPWWNPAVEDQATDRAHRIGQTKPVTVIRLVARGTIEEAVLALHAEKRTLAAGVFDEGASPASLSMDDLAGLIRAGIDQAQVEEDE